LSLTAFFYLTARVFTITAEFVAVTGVFTRQYFREILDCLRGVRSSRVARLLEIASPDDTVREFHGENWFEGD